MQQVSIHLVADSVHVECKEADSFKLVTGHAHSKMLQLLHNGVG